MSSSPWVIVAIAVGVVVVAVVVILVVRHVRFVGAIKERGWTFDGSPSLASTLGHSVPPFGLGFDRTTDDRVEGTTSQGVEFAVFEYAYDKSGGRFDDRVASLRLPVALPPVFVTDRFTRSGARGRWHDMAPGLKVGSERDDVAAALLTSPVLAAISAYGSQHTGAGGVAESRGIDLSIDGDRLVAVGAPKQADDLEPYLDSLGQIVGAVDWAALQPYAVPFTPPGYHFYGRPDWGYAEQDDAMVDVYDIERGGHSHEAVDVVRGTNDGLPVDAFEHTWVTTHTRSVSDGKGGTRTETYTQSHSEAVLMVNLPFAFPYLNVNGGWSWGRGDKVSFESEPFNDGYQVRADDARFASDVIHPRMMELIMAWQPLPFVIDGSLLRFSPGEHDTAVIAHAADFAHAFFGLVQSFVWDNLQVTPPPFRGDQTP